MTSSWSNTTDLRYRLILYYPWGFSRPINTRKRERVQSLKRTRNRLDSTTSRERTIQSCNTASGERTVWSHYTLETRWSHIVSLRGSVLCSQLTSSALQSKNSIKKDWRYLTFSHTNRPDSLAGLSQVRKARICTLCIGACLPYRFLDRLQLCASRRHTLWTSYSQIA